MTPQNSARLPASTSIGWWLITKPESKKLGAEMRPFLIIFRLQVIYLVLLYRCPKNTKRRLEMEFTTVNQYHKVWVLSINGRAKAIWSFEPSYAQMFKAAHMANDSASMRTFQSAASGITCGWRETSEVPELA